MKNSDFCAVIKASGEAVHGITALRHYGTIVVLLSIVY